MAAAQEREQERRQCAAELRELESTQPVAEAEDLPAVTVSEWALSQPSLAAFSPPRPHAFLLPRAFSLLHVLEPLHALRRADLFSSQSTQAVTEDLSLRSSQAELGALRQSSLARQAGQPVCSTNRRSH